MGFSPLSTGIRPTSQQSNRNVAPYIVVLHHAAGTSLEALLQMAQGGKQVSMHQGVKDGNRIGVVDESKRAWSLSDAYWDSAAFTVECANESTNGWTISYASHVSMAMLVADWSSRYGFKINRSGDPRTWTVIGHREVYTIHGGSYATACPGGMDLDLVVKLALEYQSGKTATVPGKTLEELQEMAANKTAFIVRDYETEGTGRVHTALVYPNGKAVALTNRDDIDASVIAHAQAFGIEPTNLGDPNKGKPRDKFGSQVNANQWNWFWRNYEMAYGLDSLIGNFK